MEGEKGLERGKGIARGLGEEEEETGSDDEGGCLEGEDGGGEGSPDGERRREKRHCVCQPSLVSATMHEYLVEPIGADQNEFFYTLHSRRFSTLNRTYLLPVDHDEVKVFRRCISAASARGIY